MKRHRWGEKTVVSIYKSERECLNGCGIVKVTRHEPQNFRDLHWVEFWRGLDQINCDATPACEPVKADA